ncbi:MAG: MFS transporter [Verrucomicrobiota bacterium]
MKSESVTAENPYEVLRNRDFVLYLLARFVASIGSQMLTVAIGWELYERTHKPLALGLVGLTQMAPIILLILPAGYVAENFDRKKTLLWTVFLTILASLGLAAISWTQAPVGWIYGCLAVAGIARTFLWPASQAFLPQLVSRKNFSRAVTWNTGAFHLSSVIGPAGGGAMIALTPHPAVVYCATALAAAICFALIIFVRSHHQAKARQTITLSSLVAGFKFVYQTKIILGTITLDMFAVLLGGATALLPVYAKDILHAGPNGLGLLQAALPLGSIVCSLYLAHRKPLQKAGTALIWSVAIFGSATIVFGFSKSFWLSFAMLAVCGVFDNVSVVIRHTLVQLLTPDAMRGRVSAVNSLFIGTSNELGGTESGFVAQFCGPVFAVVSGGVGTILVVIATALIWPQIRKYGRLDSASEETPI